jgi:hypothetical protein
MGCLKLATMNKSYIGIDPGKKGAITLVCEDCPPRSWVMPLLGKEIDIQTLSRILSGWNIDETYCVLEDVHAIFGASAGATFDFGYGLGIIEGILTANRIPYTKIAPKKWQGQMFEGVPLMQKPSSTGKTMKTDTKNMATIAVQRMYPNQDLRETVKCKKPHDGIVDSLLMAEYCRRNFK